MRHAIVTAVLTVLAAGVLTGCQQTPQTTGSQPTAGQGVINQFQIGQHFHSANTRPVQDQRDADAPDDVDKLMDTFRQGAVTITTEIAVDAGSGTATSESDTQQTADPTQDVSPQTDVTVTPGG